MRKFLSVLLVLILCIGIFTACSDVNIDDEEAGTGTGTETETETSSETGTSPSTDDASGDGSSEDESKSESETNPDTSDTPDNSEAVFKAETAYKLFITQLTLSKKLYLTGEVSKRYICTTEDPAAAPDFYVEISDGGYKFYYLNGDAKTYIKAWLEPNEGKTYKHLGFGEEGSIFTYDNTLKVLTIEIDGTSYCLGTYGEYDTAAIAESTYFTAEATYKSQFPVEFILSSEVDTDTGTEDDGNDSGDASIPTELTSIPELVALGNSKGHNEYTEELYLVKGIIVEFGTTASAKQYGNFFLEDEDGHRIYVFGLNSADGETRYDKLDPLPELGDTVTIYGVVGKYNSNPQMKETRLVMLEELDPENCTHRYSSDCDTKCNFCEAERIALTEHNYENDCDANCDDCGETRIPSAHQYDNECDIECNVCHLTRLVDPHVDADSDSICDICGADMPNVGESTTVVYSIADAATQNSWVTNSQKYTEHIIDNVVTATIQGGKNSGKYYSDGLRIYTSDSPSATLTVSAASGYALTSVKIVAVDGNDTYCYLQIDGGSEQNLANTKVFLDNVSSITFNTVENENGAYGRQLRITSIEVTYVILNDE